MENDIKAWKTFSYFFINLFDAALITRKKDVSGFHVLVRLYIC